MPQLKTLHLEPVAEDSLCPEALFTLGKDIQDLCILGKDPCHPSSLGACSDRGLPHDVPAQNAARQARS